MRLQVARKLLRELPKLRHLATLSPVPGFRAWLETRLEQELQAGTVRYTEPKIYNLYVAVPGSRA